MKKATACPDFETRSRPRPRAARATRFTRRYPSDLTFYLGNPFPRLLHS